MHSAETGTRLKTEVIVIRFIVLFTLQAGKDSQWSGQQVATPTNEQRRPTGSFVWLTLLWIITIITANKGCGFQQCAEETMALLSVSLTVHMQKGGLGLWLVKFLPWGLPQQTRAAIAHQREIMTKEAYWEWP